MSSLCSVQCHAHAKCRAMEPGLALVSYARPHRFFFQLQASQPTSSLDADKSQSVQLPRIAMAYSCVRGISWSTDMHHCSTFQLPLNFTGNSSEATSLEWLAHYVRTGSVTRAITIMITRKGYPDFACPLMLPRPQSPDYRP